MYGGPPLLLLSHHSNCTLGGLANRMSGTALHGYFDLVSACAVISYHACVWWELLCTASSGCTFYMSVYVDGDYPF